MDIIQEAKEYIANHKLPETTNHGLDLISKLLDRLEWRPIDSAPKDDKPVLVFVKYPTGYTGYYVAQYDYEHTNGRVYKEVYGNMYNIQPTHWLPLQLVGDK